MSFDTPPAPPVAPVPVPAGRPGTPQRLGKYVLLEEVGRGGMGVVYRAWDDALRRTVAVKALRLEAFAPPAPGAPSTADEERQRFLREARTLALLRHPNIVQVYEVGESDGVPYFVMEHIDGGSLRDCLAVAAAGAPAPPVGTPQLEISGGGAQAGRPVRARAAPRGRRDLLRWMVDVVRAVQHAHERGVVHRDLKPENILIRPEDPVTGSPAVPMVVDFGLARWVTGRTELTQAGQMIGTPAYMSPEQCEGRPGVDGRSDVFSLGAILYEVATGRRPFGGETPVSILYAVLSIDPTLPRRVDPRIHPDLETLLLTALQKEPERRFATAQALADDLDRYLRGEPIRARRISTAARLARRAVQHRRLLLPLGAALLLVVALAASLVVQAAHRASAAAVHLEAGRRARAAGAAAQARDAFRSTLALDEGNREARAGLLWADAEVKMIAARSEAARALAVAAEVAAREDLRKAGLAQQVLARWALLADPLRELERTYFDATRSEAGKQQACAEQWPKVDAFMRGTPPDPVSQSVMRACAGWARWLTGDAERAAEWIDQAQALEPDLPYGALMEAMIDLAAYLYRQPLPPVVIGTAGIDFGPPPPETAEMERLRTRIGKSLERAAGARVWGDGAAQDFRRAIDAIRSVQAGRYADAEAGLSASLGAAAMQVFRTDLLFARARVRYLVKRFAEGVADLDRVVAARSGQPAVYYFRGALRAGIGHQALLSGGDPRPSYAQALADLDRTLELCQSYVEAWRERGIVHWRQGEANLVRGGDPFPDYDQAVADYEEALRLDPGGDMDLCNRGIAYSAKAEAEAGLGRDAAATYTRAIADFDAALRRNPDRAEAYTNRGAAYGGLGDVQAGRGEDARASYERAVADFGAALQRKDGDPDALYNRGSALRKLGECAAAQGEDPRPTYARALADFDAALARSPRYAGALCGRAMVRWRTADASAARHEDPRAALDQAVADLDATLGIDALSPHAREYRGLILTARGDAEGERGADPRASYRAAIADLEAAVRAAPRSASTWNNRGIAWQSLGVAEAARGGDAVTCWQRALADFAQAAEVNPRHWRAHANRGLVLERMERWADAAAAYEAALRIVPGQPRVEGLLKAARAKGGR